MRDRRPSETAPHGPGAHRGARRAPGAEALHLAGDLSRRLRVLAAHAGLRGVARPHATGGRLIVSLTSYPRRYPSLLWTLRSLLAQSLRPDAVMLWLTDEERRALPAQVLALERRGLRIEHVDDDLRSYAKLVPALETYPDAVVVTADDDTYYWRTWLEALVAGHRRDPAAVWCHRAHRVRLGPDGVPLPYGAWEYATALRDDPRLVATGVGGVLYPPGALHPEVTDRAAWLRLAPVTDDLWFHWQALRAGTRVRRVATRRPFRAWREAEGGGLARGNVHGGGNDAAVSALLRAYGAPWSDDTPSAYDAERGRSDVA